MKVSTQHLISSVVTDLSLKCQISTIDCASVPVWHRLTLHCLSVWDNIQISPTHLKTSPAVAASPTDCIQKMDGAQDSELWSKCRNYWNDQQGAIHLDEKKADCKRVREKKINIFVISLTLTKTFFTGLWSHLMVLSFTEYSMIFIL